MVEVWQLVVEARAMEVEELLEEMEGPLILLCRLRPTETYRWFFKVEAEEQVASVASRSPSVVRGEAVVVVPLNWERRHILLSPGA